jgi:riboflavin kinase/FMN adenylyltransferase
MKVIRNLEDIREKLPNPVVTIGNFDGVHLGHREIFRRVKNAAAELGGVSVAITFHPHPLKVLAPDRNFKLITTYAEKEALIEASGIDYLISIPFSREFAKIPARDFVIDILVRRVGVKKIIIGNDYAFGRKREGNVDLLRRLGDEFGFSVETLDLMGNGEIPYSSSGIRSMIEDGDVGGVVPFLGRYFSVKGPVVHGLHRGKSLGFPTANVDPEEELLPKSGVYAVMVKYAGAMYKGACNIGFNPTFRGGKLSVEVHILDFEGDLYGRELRVSFVERIRDEKTFSDAKSLMQAIEKDVAMCRDVLSGFRPGEYPGKG